MATTPETELLLSYLGGQRRHVLGILDGLDDDALHRPVLPSGWTSLGLVNHLALDDEWFWFRGVVAGDRDVIDAVAAGAPDAWDVGPTTAPQQVFDRYRAEAARADEVVRATSLDAPLAWWPTELFGECWLENVREVVLHVLAETAVHAGHADAARELIDGRQRLVVTD